MSPLFPPDGVPYYVRDALPPEVLPLLSQPATADEAAAIVRTNLAGDGDVVKLFTGSWVKEGGSAKPNPVDIATAAVEAAHRHRALDRNRDGSGKSVYVRVDFGGLRNHQKKTH